jgi:hypothetical protein
MKNVINNLLIPIIDGNREESFLVDHFPNELLEHSFLNDMLDYSQRKLREKNLFIEVIDNDIILRQFVYQLNSRLYDFEKILGGKWNFDKAFFFSCTGDSESSRNSELVHHDSVGDRLKIFVGLDKVKPQNIYNRVWKYRIPRWSDYTCDEEQRGTLNTKVRNVDYIDLKVDQSEFAVFNTNLIHQGIVGSGSRNLIVIEISRSIKSKLIFGKIGGKI